MAFEFRLPDIGEGVVEGEIVRWLVQDGETLQEDQPMVEIMTDKATVELPSPVAGRVVSRNGTEGDIVHVGSVLIVIDDDSDGAARASVESEPSTSGIPAAKAEVHSESATRAAKTPGKTAALKPLATPAVRRLARQMGIDLKGVSGSGSGGRITREDLQRHSSAAGPESTPRPAPLTAGDVEVVPYRALRKRIGDHLVRSKQSAPHFTYVEEVDMTELTELRRRYLEMPDNRGGRMTYLPFLIKAVIRGLRRYPLLNSTLDEEAGEIRIKKYYHIGIATATEQGLIVPVVKDAANKSIRQLAEEIASLAGAARENRIGLEDLKGGTFTITSLGALGGVLATPIINHPEVAIMGVHKITQRPVVRNGQIVIREMMNLSLSLDHRVVDGAVGAQFLNDVIPYIESPGLLLVD